jgi:hypothetical protein
MRTHFGTDGLPSFREASVAGLGLGMMRNASAVSEVICPGVLAYTGRHALTNVARALGLHGIGEINRAVSLVWRAPSAEARWGILLVTTTDGLRLGPCR